MADSWDIPWKKLTIEGAFIVVSILLAFWIDAWWEGRQDRQNEHLVLTSLLAEFRKIRENIDDIEAYQVAILDSTRKLIQMTITPEIATEEELREQLKTQLWFSSPSNFAAPVLNSVISRGDLALITNLEIRRDLTDWPARFKWIEESLQDDFNIHRSYVMPFYYEHVPMIAFSTSDAPRPGTPSYVWQSDDFDGVDSSVPLELLQNRELQNILLDRLGLLQEIIALGRDPQLPERLEATIAILEQELQ